MLSGTILVNKYRLETLLGRGGMGAVWRAEHLGFRAPVAVKLMDREVALDPDSLARFHREAHAAASIRSPHVVQVLDHGVDEDSETPFIVMELLEGQTLGERLTREKTLSAERTAGVVGDVCRALARAHPAGIVHRDLKPDNIFLVRDEPEFAKVLDFGVAKSRPFLLGQNETTQTGSLMGTPYYMSPEQISGSKQLDARSDLWSVAVMACECLTGKRPFEADSVGGLAVAICTQPIPRASSLGAVPPGVDAWLERALQRDPAQRFQTARELADALNLACALPRIATPLAEPAPRPAAPPGDVNVLANTLGSQTAPVTVKRRSQRLRLLVVALALCSVAAALWWSRGAGPPPTAATPLPVPPAVLPVAPSERAPAAVSEQRVLAVEPRAPEPAAPTSVPASDLASRRLPKPARSNPPATRPSAARAAAEAPPKPDTPRVDDAAKQRPRTSLGELLEDGR